METVYGPDTTKPPLPLPTVVPLSGSPGIITNNTDQDQLVVVSGGLVTNINLLRGGVSTLVGLLAGQYVLKPGDQLKVNYTVAPTVTIY